LLDLRWAALVAQEGRYAYVIKIDDDNVLNPYQVGGDTIDIYGGCIMLIC
jgi:hypothetical protein